MDRMPAARLMSANLDLFLVVDEARDPGQQALDSYYRGAHRTRR